MRVLILGEGSEREALASILRDQGVDVLVAGDPPVVAPAIERILGVSGYSAKDIAAVLEDCCVPSLYDEVYDALFDYLPTSVVCRATPFTSAPRQVPSWENYKRALWVCIGL